MVRHVEVIQGSGMGVVTQGGDGVSVPEASLTFEDFAFADQLGADAVAEAVEGGLGEAGGEAESFEAVSVVAFGDRRVTRRTPLDQVRGCVRAPIVMSLAGAPVA